MKDEGIEALRRGGDHAVKNVVGHPRRSIEETRCSLSAQRSEARANLF
jgi:hypothetical protein